MPGHRTQLLREEGAVETSLATAALAVHIHDQEMMPRSTARAAPRADGGATPFFAAEGRERDEVRVLYLFTAAPHTKAPPHSLNQPHGVSCPRSDLEDFQGSSCGGGRVPHERWLHSAQHTQPCPTRTQCTHCDTHAPTYANTTPSLPFAGLSLLSLLSLVASPRIGP